MTKTCPCCTKEFDTEAESQVFCSGACIANDKRDRLLSKKPKKKKQGKRQKANIKTAEAMSKVFSEPDFSEPEKPAQNYNNLPLIQEPVSHKPFEPEKELNSYDRHILAKWPNDIEDYCSENEITPQDLIDFHKAAQKPKKKEDHTLPYFEQRQQRNMGL